LEQGPGRAWGSAKQHRSSAASTGGRFCVEAVAVLALVAIPAAVVLVLGLTALLRADRADIPRIVETMSHWLRR
jgi:hypothetical protein